MTLYSPMSRRERTALGFAAGTISLSLMAGVLTLFNDNQAPWTVLEAKKTDRDSACSAKGVPADRCRTLVAEAQAALPSKAAATPLIQRAGATLRVTHQ